MTISYPTDVFPHSDGDGQANAVAVVPQAAGRSPTRAQTAPASSSRRSISAEDKVEDKQPSDGSRSSVDRFGRPRQLVREKGECEGQAEEGCTAKYMLNVFSRHIIGLFRELTTSQRKIGCIPVDDTSQIRQKICNETVVDGVVIRPPSRIDRSTAPFIYKQRQSGLSAAKNVKSKH